jgi:hypothetical protein
MTSAHSFPWPGSRVLAGWWPTLQRWHPRALWLHHLLLHHLDAPVAVSHSPALDELHRLLLESLVPGSELGALAASLSLDVPLLSRLLAELRAAGLVQEQDGQWAQTDAGRQAGSSPQGVCTTQERRKLYFTQGDARHPGVRFLPLDHPPSPLPLSSSEGAAWAEQLEGWQFDLRELQECLGRDPAWKQAHGFPADVHSLAGGGEAWQRVVLDRAESVTVACLVTEEQDRLLGFSVQPAGWQLHGERPVLALGPAWGEALPELADPVSLEEWRQAWRAWGQPRGLPPGEIEACHLEPHGVRLRVQAPRPLVERLRGARSDALKGEAWLLAGSGGRTRTAALIDLHEEG